MPWKRKRYPPNWEELAQACKERAGWVCEHCGIADGTLRISRSKRICKVRLQAAHLDHDPENPEPRLAALCESCHDRYDHAMRRRNQIRTWGKKRYDAKLEEKAKAKAAGQLEMFPDNL